MRRWVKTDTYKTTCRSKGWQVIFLFVLNWLMLRRKWLFRIKKRLVYLPFNRFMLNFVSNHSGHDQ